MALPESLSRGSWGVTTLFAMGEEAFVLAVTATGLLSVFSVEGEEEIRGWLFEAVDEAARQPVTSALVSGVDADKEEVALVVTTLGHGVFRVLLDIQNDRCHVTPLPAPALPVTALALLHTTAPFHATARTPCQAALPATTTLLATLSDNSVFAYATPLCSHVAGTSTPPRSTPSWRC